MSEVRNTINGWSMKCGCHNYITLFYDGKNVRCFDNDNSANNEYYAENIIAAIEKRTRMKITEIPIIGNIEDFDGLRFLKGGFKKGAEWLHKSQEQH